MRHLAWLPCNLPALLNNIPPVHGLEVFECLIVHLKDVEQHSEIVKLCILQQLDQALAIRSQQIAVLVPNKLLNYDVRHFGLRRLVKVLFDSAVL